MADTVNARASHCGDCGLVPLQKSDPLEILRRTPDALYNQAPPTVDPFLGSEFDDEVLADTAVFGEIPGEGVTLQYEFARFLSAGRDLFLRAWRQAEADQLGLGAMALIDGQVRGQGFYARGAALDRVGRQYGVGRPPGFNDCCFWRLVVLVAFVEGNPPLLLVEIAELFTAKRPMAIEEVDKITLRWPAITPAPPGRRPGAQYYSNHGFADRNTYLATDAVAPTLAPAFSGYCSRSYMRRSEYSPGVPTMLHVLERVKPAGVALLLENTPKLGSAGCMGATKRRPAKPAFCR